MKKVLINVVHPNLDNESRVNKALLEFASKESNVTVNNLYKKYSDFKIDVKKEQKLLVENDIIIFQFPMYWLSSPALLKEWLDVVLEYDFAYGDNYILENKILSICTSTGANSKEFSQNGANKYSIEEFLKPFEATANYIKMNYEKPFVTYETFVISDEDLEVQAKNYIEHINKLKSL
ncbi:MULTISPECIES: NAD(P)H-dependent oxidoreductase [Arcobacteraceae]|jgi:glutathione-regulated potassium-efflux system ancillary protein KefG|uniref:Flavodoxin-like fold domain-containing protein n=1 Tax=Arcobacter porcinus TaxID=1935204 RepID=A0A5C2HDN2_9BACT|nr:MULTISPECIES: NAD(P)H-dependent oxidoreductase [Arcobacteraceae]MCT7487906.1 NAD(P)H-dependent oxidoreductase [Aliarcobacter cryaerophilus]OCL86215.1 General stress protein 14 [Arcobacter porcinus]OCL94236.1 General stress protein 14 [Aliarcobacter thereius]QEP40939.1 flavodoxin-like fold domain-containing protein [Arcobacter porcinus]